MTGEDFVYATIFPAFSIPQLEISVLCTETVVYSRSCRLPKSFFAISVHWPELTPEVVVLWAVLVADALSSGCLSDREGPVTDTF